jgi:hypothetical protein
MATLYDYNCGDIILENFNEMMLAQDAKDRLHYVDIATEAALSPAGKSKLIQQLYVDIVSKSNIDFGKIPDSKGNLTAYTYYDPMYRSIAALNQLFADKKVEELDLTNKLHDMIISCRGDFEYGYRFDIAIIQTTYCLLVMSLYDMIAICIAKYTNYLKDIKGIELTFGAKNPSNKTLVVKYVKDFIASYEKGEWSKMMLSFKQHPDDAKALISGNATESFSVTAISAAAAAKAGAFTASALGAAPWIITALVVLLIIRRISYVYYYVPYKISNAIKIQAEFLKSSIELSGDANTPAGEKQKRMLDRMNNLVTFIESRILKIDTVVPKKLMESNKEDFSKSELQAASGGEIELV